MSFGVWFVMPCGTQLSAHTEPLLIGSTSIIITTCNATSHFDSTLQMRSALPGCCVALCYFPLPTYTSRPRYSNTTPVTRYKALYASDLTVCGHAVHTALHVQYQMLYLLYHTVLHCMCQYVQRDGQAQGTAKPSYALQANPWFGLEAQLCWDTSCETA